MKTFPLFPLSYRNPTPKSTRYYKIKNFFIVYIGLEGCSRSNFPRGVTPLTYLPYYIRSFIYYCHCLTLDNLFYSQVLSYDDTYLFTPFSFSRRNVILRLIITFSLLPQSFSETINNTIIDEVRSYQFTIILIMSCLNSLFSYYYIKVVQKGILYMSNVSFFIIENLFEPFVAEWVYWSQLE